MASRFLFRAVLQSSFKIARATLQRPAHHSLPSGIQLPCLSNSITRLFCQKPALEEMCVDHEYVKKAVGNGDILIVDVREPDEVKEHGKIPNSVNIPLGTVTTALSQMADKEFKQTYQRAKPSEDTEIIFYCMIGRRSGMAQENAQKLGYKNVKNYLGSWNDWAAKIKS